MSISTIEVILDRVAGALEYSPIAIFSTQATAETARFEALFANTIMTKQRIKNDESSLVGIYDLSVRRDYLRWKLRDKALHLANKNKKAA